MSSGLYCINIPQYVCVVLCVTARGGVGGDYYCVSRTRMDDRHSSSHGDSAQVQEVSGGHETKMYEVLLHHWEENAGQYTDSIHLSTQTVVSKLSEVKQSMNKSINWTTEDGGRGHN